MPSLSAVRAACVPEEAPEAAACPAAAARRHSYSQILRSSALIGGSAAVNTAAAVLRAKAMALLLGPAGVGLMGLYGSILDLTHSIAGLGINSSGVRQMAEAAGSGDNSRVSRTAAVLRRTSVALGVAGGLFLLAFCRPIAIWTFGSENFAAPVALLSVAVLFRLISGGEGALIQGMRRIGDLARIGVLSAAAGTVLTVTLVYLMRERGVVPSLVASGAVALLITCWYGRKVNIPRTRVSASEVREEASALLKLGAVFMVSGVLSTGAAYAIRILVRDSLGFEAAGLYQAAWTLGSLYVAFILQAMGSDFYPRLTGLVNDHPECNRVVNEQAHVSMLLAGPGLIATLTFAPIVVALFYDRTFVGAVQPLRWICMGMALRIIAWPMGYIVVAKGARRTLIWTEVAAVIVHLGMAAFLMRPFGLAGAAMGFFALYVWHGALMYWIVRRWTGFRWSAANRRTGLLFVGGISFVFCTVLWLPSALATPVGAVAAIWSGSHSWRTVRQLVSDAVPDKMRRRFA
jgi:antigen flippase